MKKLCLYTAMGLLGVGSVGSVVSGSLLAQTDLPVMPDKETISWETHQGMMLAQATPQEMPMPMPMTDNGPQ